MKLNLYTYFVFFLFALSANAQPFNTTDIAALNDFLLSTNGGSLSAPAGWNAALPTTQQWRIGNPETQWYGISWTVGSVNRRVKIINLADLALGSSPTNGVAVSGLLPNFFIASGRMDSLQELNLKNNRITAGPLTPWVYTSFALVKVNISENNFGVASGLTICSYILTGASNLQELYADRYLSSPAIVAGLSLPSLPTGLLTLQVLDMRNNGFQGNAALLFSSLPNLKKIYLTNNRLEQLGLTTHANLETVVIGDNELDSAIYLQNILANFSALQMLEAEDALNTGILQSHPMFTITVGSTFNNIYVNIGGNKLTGAINLGSSGFSRIGTFIARNNNLTTVSFPTSFNTSLSFLNLEQNDFNQALSIDFFSKFPAIQKLYIGANDFYGNLPTPSSTSYFLPNLRELSLANCALDGAIRLDWLLDSQNGSLTRNGQLHILHLDGNDFSDIVVHNNFPMPFDSLVQLRVYNNRLEFNDLYLLVGSFGLVMLGPVQGYQLLNPLGQGEFAYGPQAPIGIGGVRRRRSGTEVIFRPKTLPPISFISQDTLYNDYTWYRRDTMGGAFNVEYLGRMNLLANSLNTTNLDLGFGSSNIAGSLNLLPEPGSLNFGNVGLRNIDNTHNGWIYYAVVQNDSFPGLNLDLNPVRLVVADCFDTLGNVIRCQEILVRYNPDSLAVYGANAELFKRIVRAEVGAEKVSDCVCGNLELWEMNDTTNMAEMEQLGTGTRTTSGQATTKAELLSAEPNYYVESDNLNIPTTAPTFAQGSTHPKPTLVAIIDSGTDYDHPQLRTRIWVNTADTSNNNTDDDADCVADNGWGYNFLAKNNIPYDDQGHGSAIAGIVGGYSDFNIAQNTTAYDSLALVPMKFTDKEGNGSLYHAACAIFHAAQYQDLVGTETNRIRVINASWGYYGEPSPSLDSAMRYAANQCGMLFITSAGNDGISNDTSDHYPSNFDLPNIITVAATTPNGTQLDTYSNFGANQVDLAARGDDVTTLAGSNGNTQASIYGTSFATAQVSRAAGLLFHAYPQATYYAVKEALMRGVDILPSADSSKLVSGGRLNLQKAMNVMSSILNPTECSDNIMVNTIPLESLGNEMQLTVYPNPFTDALQIDVETQTEQDANLTLKIYGVDGKLFASQEFNHVNNKTTLSISTQNLPAGLYFLHLANKTNHIVKKIVKI